MDEKKVTSLLEILPRELVSLAVIFHILFISNIFYLMSRKKHKLHESVSCCSNIPHERDL